MWKAIIKTLIFKLLYGHNYIIMRNIYNILIIKNLVLIIYKNKKYLIRCFKDDLMENTISVYFWYEDFNQSVTSAVDRPSNLDSGEIVGVTSKYVSICTWVLQSNIDLKYCIFYKICSSKLKRYNFSSYVK